MKNLVLSLVMTLALSNISFSQQKSKMGLGMSIGTTTFYADANMHPKRLVFTSIYLPIHISETFKVEPEFGFTNYSMSYDSDYESREISNTGLKLGMGLFRKKQVEQTQIYYGVRLGIIRESEEYSYSYSSEYGDFSDSETEKITNKFIAPAFGAEHFFSPAFSFGGETQFTYTIFDTGESDADFTSFDNSVHLFLRWYWN